MDEEIRAMWLEKVNSAGTAAEFDRAVAELLFEGKVTSAGYHRDIVTNYSKVFEPALAYHCYTAIKMYLTKYESMLENRQSTMLSHRAAKGKAMGHYRDALDRLIRENPR